MRWMSRLTPKSRGGEGRQYDVVVGGYMLGELRSDEERRRVVHDLWLRTQGVLVLVEPGTPSGFSHIHAARSQILSLRAGPPPTEKESGSSSSVVSSSGGSSSGAVQSAPDVAAAHVLAPCPHDSTCPLLRRRSWCHFVQRFERTDLQRRTKAVGSGAPRVYQDERFSYVVLARGPRPPAATPAPRQQVAVSGRMLQQPDDPQAYENILPHIKPRSIGTARPLWEELEHGQGGGEGGQGAELADELAGDDADEATRQLILESILSGMGEDEEEAEGLAALEAELREEMFKAPHLPLPSESPPSPGTHHSWRPPSGHRQQELDFQMAGEGEGKDVHGSWSADQEDERGNGSGVGPVLPPSGSVQAVGQGVWEGEGGGEVEWGGGEAEWQERDPEGVAAAVAASGAWSRVLRMPRKRSGHVVLDLCSAVQADASPATEGVLLRQVVSRGSAIKQLGGTAAYRLARRARWGDMWPLHYQRRLKAMVPPASEGFQQ